MSIRPPSCYIHSLSDWHVLVNTKIFWSTCRQLPLCNSKYCCFSHNHLSVYCHISRRICCLCLCWLGPGYWGWQSCCILCSRHRSTRFVLVTVVSRYSATCLGCFTTASRLCHSPSAAASGHHSSDTSHSVLVDVMFWHHLSIRLSFIHFFLSLKSTNDKTHCCYSMDTPRVKVT